MYYCKIIILQLPLLDTSDLTDYGSLRHAHLILGLLINCYVWQDGDDQKPPCIPEVLARPMVNVSTRAQLPPIVCHADLVLTNYIQEDKCKPLELG